MPRCYANSQCWEDCCEWCMAMWEEPNGPCHTANAHGKVEAFEIEGERLSVTANHVPGEALATMLGGLLPEDLAMKIRASEKNAFFSLASVTRDELLEAIRSFL